MRFARDTIVLLARRLQLNMFPLPDVSRTTPEDDLLKSRPCHGPCREAMSKFCVLGITRGRDYHTHRSDTRHFAFPLTNGYILLLGSQKGNDALRRQ